MKEVSIFIVTSTRSPGKTRKAWYRYILVCEGASREKKVQVTSTTPPLGVGVRCGGFETHDKACNDHFLDRLPLFCQRSETACGLERKWLETARWERGKKSGSVAADRGAAAPSCSFFPRGEYGAV